MTHKVALKKSEEKTRKPNRFRITSIIIAMAITAVILLSGLSSLVPDHQEKATTSTITSYPNTDDAVIWCRINGSNPGTNWPGANVAPLVGMNYFGTQTVQVTTIDYSFATLKDNSKFPLGTREYVNIGPDPLTLCTQIADEALTNPRIMGGWWDDFPTGQQSNANMSALYTAIHHNDLALGRNLTLGLVVYEYNYYKQSPYSWSDIMADFDIAHFWFYPDDYGLTYANFAGFETALRDFHRMIPSKEIWIGMYLHFYDWGPANNSFPLDMTYNWLGISGRMFREGIATKLSILETFWIQHNTATAALVRDYLNTEMTPIHASLVNTTNSIVSSTTDGVAVSALVHDVILKNSNDWVLVSDALQNVTITGLTGSDIRAWNMRTGAIENCAVGSWGASFFAEPGEKYRVLNMALTNAAYTSPTVISTPTAIVNKTLYVNTTLTVKSSLWINNSVVLFGPTAPYVDCMRNHTPPMNGVVLDDTANCMVYISDSAIDATLRDFPYFFNTNKSTGSAARVLNIVNSTVSCYSGTLNVIGYTHITDSTLYNPQPDGGSVYGLMMYMGGVNEAFVKRCLIQAPVSFGAVGVLVQVLNGFPGNALVFDDNTVVGGEYGIWIDSSYSPGMFNRCDVFSQAVYSPATYSRFKSDSTSDANRVLVTTPFHLASSVPITGTLTSGNGTIGTYSTSNGTINVTVQDATLGATVIARNPYPWNFSISTDLTDSSFYYMATETAPYQNESYASGTRYLSFNASAIAITGGTQTAIHVLQVDKKLFTGTSNYISSGNTLTLADRGHAWSEYPFPQLSQVSLSASISAGILTVYDVNPTSDSLMLWRASGASDATFTLSSLDIEVGYKVYVDGVLYYQQLKGLTDLTFTYSGPWSEHEFQVIAWDMGKPDVTLDASFSYTINGNLVTFTDKSYGPVVNWIWNFGDGTGSTKQSPTHTYKASGKYVVSLTVYDSDGHSSKASVDITLALGPNFPVERNPSGWDIYISDQLTVSMSAVGLLVGGAIMYVSAVVGLYVPVITPKGRKVIGVLAILAGLYFLIFVDNSWMKF